MTSYYSNRSVFLVSNIAYASIINDIDELHQKLMPVKKLEHVPGESLKEYVMLSRRARRKVSCNRKKKEL